MWKLLQCDKSYTAATVLGRWIDGVVTKPTDDVPLTENHLKIIENKQAETFGFDDDNPQLCIPLIGLENSVIGLVLLNLKPEYPLQDFQKQILIILTTLIAIAIEKNRFYHLAMFDGLTGLYIRRQFDLRLQEEIARIQRYGGHLSMFMIDIDHFKRFNDTYGHQQGDTILQELAGILRGTIRADVDIPCRYGGEEFITIMPNTHLQAAYAVVERLRQHCQEYPFPGQKEALHITVSGGVAAIDHDNMISTEEFVKRADKMLYKAKESGRNRICMWK